VVAAALVAAGPARAFEAFDGALQLHGYFEIQTRVLARDYSPNDGYHLAQWYNILNVELEWDAAPQGWGPFNLVSGFVRAEVRYDCVWTGGCYMLPGYKNRYGVDAERLPRRLSNARKDRLIGVIDPGEFADKRNLIQLPVDERLSVYGAPAGLGQEAPNQRSMGAFWNLPGLSDQFFPGAGYDEIWGTDDDPGRYVAERFLDYRFAFKRLPGNVGGNGVDIQGPWRPQDEIPAPGALRDRANPFKTDELNPVLKGPPPDRDDIYGAGELPFRPGPINSFADPNDSSTLAPLDEAQGLYIPNAGFVRALAEDNLELAPDQNFLETELAMNHGASQDPFYELKEAYVDLEMFDHHLWLRLGLQTIVWGKTELFRAQDQFNPQDLGLASLPSLEESRVPLLSARGIWSFYDVGPLQDVRLELAINFDKVYPADTGRCGEPFAPRASCTRAYGFFSNALVGTGIAGEYRYPYPWKDPQSLEGGARLEFRQDRISYALTYFTGFDDFPYQEPVFLFERNVDPLTGRPRHESSRARCDPQGLLGEPDFSGCLGVFDDGSTIPGLDLDPGDDFDVASEQLEDALENHHANQQLFTAVCGASVTLGNPLNDPSACAFNGWNSTARTVTDDSDPLTFLFAPRSAMGFSAMLAGSNPLAPPFDIVGGKAALFNTGRFATYGSPLTVADMPLAVLVNDGTDDYDAGPDDAFFSVRYDARGLTAVPEDSFSYTVWRPLGVARALTDEQEALIGCGRFYGTDCDVDGFDFFVGEGSALFQSWPGFEGTEGGIWLTTDSERWQPGTLDFDGGPICTRYEAGETFVLPGCNAGTPPPGGHPFADIPGMPGTPQPWSSELAALSWNMLMTFVTLSVVPAKDDDGELLDGRVCGVDATCTPLNGLNDAWEDKGLDGRFDQFNPNDPYNPERCSWANPVICSIVKTMIGVTGAGKNTVRAGGNPRFGRRDFLWHGGAQIALDYQRNHILGFAMDFAHDRSGSSWNIEATWFRRVRLGDLDSFDMNSRADLLNLTIGVDRPTFIRFLNKNQSFFLTAQLFMQYVVGYEKSFTTDGPFNARMTVGVFSGYHQDRLLPGVILVYDFSSYSGAVLWRLGWRVNQSFLIQIGFNTFWGEVDRREAALVAAGTAGQGGRGEGAYHSYVENGLSSVRDRDELFVRLRYTF